MPVATISRASWFGDPRRERALYSTPATIAVACQLIPVLVRLPAIGVTVTTIISMRQPEADQAADKEPHSRAAGPPGTNAQPGRMVGHRISSNAAWAAAARRG